MIVKNESHIIKRCLTSILPIVDYWVIVDTGSTDETEAIIQKTMQEYKIEGELHKREWVNFSHNRNEALELAKNKADYILFLDADEYLSYEKDFKISNLTEDYYTLNVSYGSLHYNKIHIVKSTLPIKWEGVLHEALQPNRLWTFKQLKDIRVISSTEGCRSQDPLKYQNDIKILNEALKIQPNHPRNTFYLAQSYRDDGNYLKALETYEKRVELKGWEEEIYYSFLQIGILKERLQRPLEEIISAYKKAFCFRKTRGEALVHLARLYREQKDYLTAYLFAKFAMNLKPSHDVLFVHQSLFEFDLPLELSVCAYWIGNHKEFVELTQSLLRKPSLPPHIEIAVKKNVAFMDVPMESK